MALTDIWVQYKIPKCCNRKELEMIGYNWCFPHIFSKLLSNPLNTECLSDKTIPIFHERKTINDIKHI